MLQLKPESTTELGLEWLWMTAAVQLQATVQQATNQDRTIIYQ